MPKNGVKARVDDEVAFRTESINAGTAVRSPSMRFMQAERMGGKVFGGPKYTVSPIYEGMLKKEMDAAPERHPECAISRS